MSDILSGPCLAGFDDFCAIMEHHEEVVGKCICQNPLKSQFKDFQGVIKSLGAWGGDFSLRRRNSRSGSEEIFSREGADDCFQV